MVRGARLGLSETGAARGGWPGDLGRPNCTARHAAARWLVRGRPTGLGRWGRRCAVWRCWLLAGSGLVSIAGRRGRPLLRNAVAGPALAGLCRRGTVRRIVPARRLWVALLSGRRRIPSLPRSLWIRGLSRRLRICLVSWRVAARPRLRSMDALRGAGGRRPEQVDGLPATLRAIERLGRPLDLMTTVRANVGAHNEAIPIGRPRPPWYKRARCHAVRSIRALP